MPCYSSPEEYPPICKNCASNIQHSKVDKESIYYPLYLKYEKLFCTTMSGLLDGTITKNAIPEDIKKAYIEHRQEDIDFYRKKYLAEISNISQALPKESDSAKRQDLLNRLETLTTLIRKIENMSPDDILNREYEKEI